MKQFTALLLICVLLAMGGGVGNLRAQMGERIKPPKMPDLTKGRGAAVSRGDEGKLSPELQMLYQQYSVASRGGVKGVGERVSMNFDAAQLQEIFGIKDAKEANPTVGVAVKTTAKTDVSRFKQAGMKVYMQMDEMIFGKIPVLSLGKIADERNVSSIEAVKSTRTPKPPGQKFSFTTGKAAMNNLDRAAAPLANEFPKANLTGKGTIVGVIDTGIDWKHQDFRRADGTSRVLAIWDMTDDSYADAGVGTSPPTLPGGETLFGTIYTNKQINDALKGKGAVNAKDTFGHGTAVAGTAAGNGAGKLSGVAPDADLIIVRAGDCGGFSDDYIYGAAWIVETAKLRKRPVVVNLSLGGHYSAHDGTQVEEKLLNSLTGKGKPGVVFTVSAGNEGEQNMHAAGVFGANRPGQEDIDGAPVITNVFGGGTWMLGVFDARDDWGMYVRSMQSEMQDDEGNQVGFSIFKQGGKLQYQYGGEGAEPEWFKRYAETAVAAAKLGAQSKTASDWLTLNLPQGTYAIWGFGTTSKVINGNYNLYLPGNWSAGFVTSTFKSGMVGSPGNATNVITVGAYNFRRDWLNNTGSETLFNFAVGDIAGYSSPGGRRALDKVVKPDIAAPASYTISPLSGDVSAESCYGGNMLARPNAENFLTADGKHIAWEGTSASAPFTAGVIALMLQKNPKLDAEQVRGILVKTARKGDAIGATPNAMWGNGMLDPAAALLNTPAGK